MKNIIIIFIIGFFIICSCKKSSSPASPTSLTIINALSDEATLRPTFNTSNNGYSSNVPSIFSGDSKIYSPISGVNSLSVFQSVDTTKSLFNGSYTLIPGGIYSLYVMGIAAQWDTLFIKENLVQYNDSVTGIRCINLISKSNPINIFIQGNSVPDFTNLAYKQVTNFNRYFTKNMETDYVFEVHDAVSDSILASYDLSITQHKNQTLVIYGSEDVNNPFPINIFQVNNY